MGKHKHKHKHRTEKSKKSKIHKVSKQKSSESDDDEQIVWTENTLNKDDEQEIISNNEICDQPRIAVNKSALINNNDHDDLLDLFNKTSTNNPKYAISEKNKKDVKRKEEQIRYSRELNSHFRDDVNKKFIDNFDESKKLENSNKILEESTNQTIKRNNSHLEINTINAKIIKAELLGDVQLVNELKEKLKQLNENERTQVEYITKSRSQDKISEDTMTVKELYFKTKSITAREEAMRFVASTSKIKSTDDEYEDTRIKKKTKLDVIGFDRLVFQDDGQKCDWCLSKFGKHLILKFSYELSYCYVALTRYKPFVPNICQIICKDHSTKCSLEADQECWSEIRQVMRTLSSFFNQCFNCIVVFMETFFMKQKINQNISKKHFVIECVPIKQHFDADAKIFFHKAILECGKEWSINKKLIKLEKKSIIKKLPKGLAYFWVSFGPEFDGYAHVIEDEDYFDKNFGKEVIAGLYDVNSIENARMYKMENYDTQFQRIKELKNKWRDFIEY